MERSKFSEERQKSHFETGVKMGVGTFNLVSWQLFTGKCLHQCMPQPCENSFCYYGTWAAQL